MKTILAIDIGGSKMLAGLARGEGDEFEIVQTVGEPLPAEMTEDGILREIDKLCAQLPLDQIDAVGVTIPGLADERVWIYAPFIWIQNFQIMDAI